jgi:uncharacterized protein YkwD
MKRRYAEWIAMLSLTVSTLTSAGSLAAEPHAGKLAAKDTPASSGLNQREAREVNLILAHYRRAKGDLSAKAAAVDEAIEWGTAAVSALSQIIGKEMQPQLEKYRSKFYQQAGSLSKTRLSKVDVQEIARLRSDILDLSKAADLSHEMIVEKGDPAIKRLTEVFIVNRMEVLEGSETLQADRKNLLSAGSLWERCGVHLYEQLPEGPEKPKEPPSFEKYLEGEEELAVGLAVPMTPKTQAILAANAAVVKQLDPEESRAILALNVMRNLLGLNPVMIDLKLCAAARDHSHDMETKKFFAHDSPVPGKKTPWDRAARMGTSASAENIFAGSQDGAAANLAWFHSPGHHKNMLGAHKRVGMGRSGVHFTEMFGD